MRLDAESDGITVGTAEVSVWPVWAGKSLTSTDASNARRLTTHRSVTLKQPHFCKRFMSSICRRRGASQARTPVRKSANGVLLSRFASRIEKRAEKTVRETNCFLCSSRSTFYFLFSSSWRTPSKSRSFIRKRSISPGENKMKFGHVDNPKKINYTIPPDHCDTAKVA